jgi:hypothetical protein
MSPVDTFCLPELCNRYLLSRECMLTIQAVRRTMCSSRSVIDMTCLDSDIHLSGNGMFLLKSRQDLNRRAPALVTKPSYLTLLRASWSLDSCFFV